MSHPPLLHAIALEGRLTWYPVHLVFVNIHDRIREVNPVTVNPKIQGGVACFTGTRVPVSSLFDHLQRGYTVEQFIEDFPTVTKDQIDTVLEMVKSDIPKHAEHVTAR